MLRKDKARKRVLKYHEEEILGRRGLHFIHFTYVLFKKKKTKEAKSNNIQGKIIPSKKSATAETLTGGMPRPPEEHKAVKSERPKVVDLIWSWASWPFHFKRNESHWRAGEEWWHNQIYALTESPPQKWGKLRASSNRENGGHDSGEKLLNSVYILKVNWQCLSLDQTWSEQERRKRQV